MGWALCCSFSCLPATPREVPKADGIVALTGGDDAAGHGRGACSNAAWANGF